MGQRAEEEELERERDVWRMIYTSLVCVCVCVYVTVCILYNVYESVCECEYMYVCVQLHSNMLYLQAVRVQRASWPVLTFPGQQTHSEICPTGSSDGILNKEWAGPHVRRTHIVLVYMYRLNTPFTMSLLKDPLAAFSADSLVVKLTKAHRWAGTRWMEFTSPNW